MSEGVEVLVHLAEERLAVLLQIGTQMTKAVEWII
jgi:hypothetical protein